MAGGRAGAGTWGTCRWAPDPRQKFSCPCDIANPAPDQAAGAPDRRDCDAMRLIHFALLGLALGLVLTDVAWAKKHKHVKHHHRHHKPPTPRKTKSHKGTHHPTKTPVSS